MSKKKSLRYLDMEPYHLTGVRAFFEESKALSQIRGISALWQEQTEGVRAALSAVNSANAFNQQLSGITSALSSYQAAMDSLRFPTEGIRAMLSSYQNSVATIGYPSIDAHSAVSAIQSHIDIFQNSVGKIHSIYSPITEYSKHLDGIFNKSFASLLKTQSSIADVISGMDLSAFSILSEALPNNIFEQDWFENLTVNDISEIYENEDFAEDVAEELREIIEKKDFSVDKNWSAEKKAKWYTALRYLCVIIMFLASPVVDYTKDKALDTFGITEFWNETGIYECIDAFFDSFNKETVTEEEAKQTVDTTKTGNISKQKREDLLAKIKEIRTFISAAPQDENTGNLLSYLSELEKDVNGKKYGLVFEEHREEIDEVLDTHTPVLTEDEELFIDNGGQMNFLIEGDNLASLKLLEKTHKGKIDLIYIDPPYNTGSKDFIYDDVFVDKTDLFSHSKWLSFMECRLKIARKLLSKKGAIFISIDDNEQAPLKMLCDAIFSEGCFVADISWQRTYSMRNDSKGIASEIEHILVYSKNIDWNPRKLERTAEMDSKYKNPDNDPKGPWRNIVASAPNASTHQGMVYAIQNPLTGEYCYPPQGRCWALGQEQMLNAMCQWCEYELKDLEDDEKRAQICGVSPEDVRKNVLSIVIKCSLFEAQENAKKKYDDVIPEFFFSQKGKGALSRKAYINNMGGRPVTNFWPHSETGHTDEASRLLKTIFDGTAVFDTPKPPRLIERILYIATNDDSVVLDFFAGSGTTGHAVLKYNATNKDSNRRFILCTNNENNICRDVTYERIKRVIDKEGYKASLKYCKVDYIPVSERMYYEYADELLHHIRELVELENGINFTDNAEIAIVLTDEEFEDFIANIKEFSKCKKLYMGHDILPDEEQEQALSTYEIEVNIIPDYYYKDLQEG